MTELIYIATHGFDAKDEALALVRIAIGGFFAISGFNKLFVPHRHAALRSNLEKNNIPCVPLMEWWVPGWEFVAGIMLVLGMMSAFAASVLIVICIVACWCEAKEKVERYAPINSGDRIADYLYLPEVLYIILLSVTVLAGTGKYSMDYYLIPLGG